MARITKHEQPNTVINRRARGILMKKHLALSWSSEPAPHEQLPLSINHLPIQNRVKMCVSNSSGARLPVTSSSAARASCKSARTNSSDSDPPSASAALRARSRRVVSAFYERHVPHVRHRGRSPSASKSSASKDPRPQVVESCPGRRRDRNGAVTTPDEPNILLVYDDKCLFFNKLTEYFLIGIPAAALIRPRR